MKNLTKILALSILFVASSYSQDVKTMEKESPISAAQPQTEVFVREKFDPTRDPKADLATAVQAASNSGKRIILDVGGEWCGWCVYMDTFFSKNPVLSKIRDDNFIWVKVNMSEQNENKSFLKPYPEPSGYPHLYILSKTGRLLRSQDTSYLELAKGYNLVKFTRFLRSWSPKKVHK